ncbi:MAG: T9SS type A sorting domain-containing protein [Ignavibacteriae bacterium]|nr:T9SS type A sorting domain-containing protein [Ignavibacteriota bacterium]
MKSTSVIHRFFLLTALFPILAYSAFAQSPWRSIAQPTTKDLRRLSFIDSATGWVCGREGVIFRTTTGGSSWEQQHSGVTGDFHCLFMLNDRYGWGLCWDDYIDTATFFGTRIIRTTNGGNTWHAAQYPIWGKYFHALTFFDSLDGWMVGEGGDIEKTTDGGLTWTRARVDSSELSQMAILNVRFFSKEVGFGMGGALDFAGALWVTTNAGENWFVLNVSPEPVYEMHFVDSLNFIGIAGDFDFGASMIRSSDGGRTWEYTYLAIFGQPRAMSWRTPREAWVPVGNTLMVTYDTARTWNIVDTLGWRIPYDLTFTDSLTGYLVTDSGFVYKYKNRVMEATEPNEMLPAVFSLEQNYPNPFNPTTTIEFSLPKSSEASLKIFDILGREVATLVNEHLNAGTFKTEWDAKNMPSGTYFYRLQAGDASTGSARSFVATKKLLLLR